MQVLSTRTHTIIGLIVGLALIAAPWLFGFADQEAAMMVPLYLGILIVISELITTSPISLIKLVPMNVHIIIDIVAGLFLLASPWIFGFADLAINAWIPHVAVGILIVGYALITRTNDEKPMLAAE